MEGVVRDSSYGSPSSTRGGERWHSPLAALWRSNRQGQEYRWGGLGEVSLATGEQCFGVKGSLE